MTISRVVRFAFLLFMIPGFAMAIEEPEFETVGEFSDFEIRQYPPYIIAEVDVQGGFGKADSSAFRILAGYIFGDNAAAQKMAMTAPVESRPSEKGEKMAMTAPVTATAGRDEGQTTYAFVMERKYTLDSLPVPNDERIRIRTVPERTVAVRRYSGRWSQKNYLQHESTLLTALEANGIRTVGRPTLARYNSPFSLPPFRRNEVMIEIMPDTVTGLRE